MDRLPVFVGTATVVMGFLCISYVDEWELPVVIGSRMCSDMFIGANR